MKVLGTPNTMKYFYYLIVCIPNTRKYFILFYYINILLVKIIQLGIGKARARAKEGSC